MARAAKAPATEPAGTPPTPDTSTAAPEMEPVVTTAIPDTETKVDESTGASPLVTFSLEALELLTANFNAQRLVQGDEVVQMAIVQDGDSYTLEVVRESIEPVETPTEDIPAEDTGTEEGE